jgi:hypothetical protein
MKSLRALNDSKNNEENHIQNIQNSPNCDLGNCMRSAIRLINGIYDHDVVVTACDPIQQQINEIGRMPLGSAEEIHDWRNQWLQLIELVKELNTRQRQFLLRLLPKKP